MNNMQNNFYGIPWQQSSQQINYGQVPPTPYGNQPQMQYDVMNQFSAPPPPPPENHRPPEPTQNVDQNVNVRRQQQSNFGNNLGYSNDNTRTPAYNFNQGNNDKSGSVGNYNQGFSGVRGSPSNNINQGFNNACSTTSNSRNNRHQNNRGNRRGGQHGYSRFNDGNNTQNFQYNESQVKTQPQQSFGNQREKITNNNRNKKGNRNNFNNSPASNNQLPGPSTNSNPIAASPFSQATTVQPSFSFDPNAGSGVDSFESEFRKWEEQFERWLYEMKDHPDKQQYETYKEQFLEYRKMLSTRLQKLKGKAVSTPSMTEEQIKFKNAWSAGNPSKTETQPSTSSNLYEASTSAVQQLPPTSFTSQNDIPVSSMLFGKSKTMDSRPGNFSTDDDENFTSFSHSVPPPAFANFTKQQATIPGLEFDSTPETPNEINTLNDEVVLDDEPENDLPPPPVPTFSLKKTRCMIKINDILEEPGRSNRHEKILILIRGAPGSGKHYLANLIESKELEKNNDRTKIITIRNYIIGKNYDPSKAGEYDEKQFNEFKELTLEGFRNFIIVVLNGCGIRLFNRLTHFACNKFDVFTIEVHQKPEICQQYSKYRRNITEITNAIDDLMRFSTPIKFKLLDPISLYYPNSYDDDESYHGLQPSTSTATANSKPFRQSVSSAHKTQPHLNTESFSSVAPTRNTILNLNNVIQQQTQQSSQDDFAEKMAQILKNEKVLELLQAHMNSAPAPQSQAQPPNNSHSRFQQQSQPQASFEEVPVFKPEKVVDYNHLHKPTFEESLMEFKVFRTIEYKHRTSHMLNDFVKDVDVDKIIEKRKAVALRKKILEYLRNAQRPEDTVSNPKYPRNWEVIQRERPPRKSKRRKRLTAKIKRILLIKTKDENSWMTKGYVKDTNEPMDLEAISSESDDDLNDQPVSKKSKSDDIFPPMPAKSLFVDEYKDVYKTIPDFNHFNHPNYVNIKKVLYPQDRRSRPSKILIILRGSPGSGKSHLAQLIKRKEGQNGNVSDIRILSIDDYFLTEDDDEEECDQQSRTKVKQKYLENIQRHLKKTINENLYNLIVIDAENCDLNYYNQFYQIGFTMGFSVYTIELYQTAEICAKQCKRSSAVEDIPNAIELLNKNRIPNSHTLLIPTELYKDFGCFVNPLLNTDKKTKAGTTVEEKDGSIKSYQNFLVQTIDDDDYLSLMPQFNWHNRAITDIREIVEEPGRLNRTKNIAVLFRGPGGAGKGDLAAAIIKKEKEHGNDKTLFISIEEFFMNEATKKYEFNSRRLDENVQKLFRKLMEVTRSKTYNFIIVDAETGDFSHYTQVYERLAKQNQCYTIEMYQDAKVCVENDIHKRPQKEIEAVLEEMTLNPTPDDHILLDCAIFYKHQPLDNLDKPLKSALKISPNTSLSTKSMDENELEKIYDQQTERLSLHEKFQASFNQRVNVKGQFIERNSCPPSNLPEFNWFNEDIVDIREILEEPGRSKRADKIVIFIRGAPGSGKTYLAGLIARKELEKGNKECFQLLSIDEYFEAVKYRETEFEGLYEKYIESSADSTQIDDYMNTLEEDFSNLLESNEPAFVVLDGDFCDLKYYKQMSQKALSSGFTCYVIELNQDDSTCVKYNDHKWDESYIFERNKTMQNIQSPKENILLDPEYLYHEYNYEFDPEGDVFGNSCTHMDISDENEADFVNEEDDDESNELSFGKFKMSAQKSKWDDDETPDIERLDGIKSKSSKRVTMADYLQVDDSDEWSMRPSTSGKKRVRWADIEEKKAQEHMRKIGFIVGHTDWNRMTDDSDGKSALEKTKFIEPRNKKR